VFPSLCSTPLFLLPTMPSPLRNFALFWNLRLRFFLDTTTSLRRRLDWDSQNADGTPLPIGYGVKGFRCPRRLFHERSNGASLMLAFGYSRTDSGVRGPEPIPQTDGFLRLWLAMFAACVSRFSFRVFLDSVFPPVRYYPSPQYPIFDFCRRVVDYPRIWSLNEIAHQHFLACAWLSFWCVEERGPANWPIRVFWLWRADHPTMPPIFDELLDRMALSFETTFNQYCQSQQDHIHKDRLRNHFQVVVGPLLSS
jgi:hypothetical protein